MAELKFIYGPMSSGKSTHLLLKAHSLMEKGIGILCMKPSVDDRYCSECIVSRVGLKADCLTIDANDNIYNIISQYIVNLDGMCLAPPKYILCDESQFLTSEHIDQLAEIVDRLCINVICYGLRNDFTGHLFDGSKRLFELSDSISEIEVLCECGNKSIMNARIDEFGNVSTNGEQIEIGGNELYKTMCRKCYFENVKCK